MEWPGSPSSTMAEEFRGVCEAGERCGCDQLAAAAGYRGQGHVVADVPVDVHDDGVAILRRAVGVGQFTMSLQEAFLGFVEFGFVDILVCILQRLQDEAGIVRRPDGQESGLADHP